MKKLLFCLPLLFFLGGCGRIELGEEAGQLLPVSALALSLQEDGEISLTLESIRQDSLDGGATPVYLSASGADLSSAFDNADQMLAHRLYLSHAQTILISPAFAAEQLPELIEYLLNRRDARLSIRIATARDAAPEDALRADAVAEEIPGVALSAMLDQRAKEGRLPNLPFYRLLDRYLQNEDFSLPALSVSADGHVQPNGQAVFSGGVLTGFVDPAQDTKGSDLP